MTHHITDEQIVAAASLHLGECVVENCGLGDIKDFARAVLALAAPQGEPYGWAVTGCHSLYRGEWAESTAQAEARRCGGTAVAFPLYTAPAPAVPSDIMNMLLEIHRRPNNVGIWLDDLSRIVRQHREALTAAPTPTAQERGDA